jgi:DNA invertase Pin-like site-specific DNA recombinase
MQNIAYLRRAPFDPDAEPEKEVILAFAGKKGFSGVSFVSEAPGGTAPWLDRRIGEILSGMGKGDRLMVVELSHLGRSMIEILEMLAFAREQGIAVYAIQGGWEFHGDVRGAMMGMAFKVAADIERKHLSPRVPQNQLPKDAPDPAGPKGGTSKLDPFREEIGRLLRNGATKVSIARRYEISTTGLYNWLKKNERLSIEPPDGENSG